MWKERKTNLTSEKSNSGMEIPDYAIERIARCLLPIMQEYFESEEGQQELREYEQTAEEWVRQMQARRKVPPAFLQPQNEISRIKTKNPNPLPIGIKFGFLHCGGRGWIRTTEVDDGRFTVCSLWPLGNSSTYLSLKDLELVDGLEPPTCWLQISCSTNWATPAQNAWLI